MTGFAQIPRAIWTHKAFQNDQERLLYVWIAHHAAWQPISFERQGLQVHVERGQYYFSMLFLEKKFNYCRKKMRRFFSRLHEAKIISFQPLNDACLITLKNFD